MKKKLTAWDLFEQIFKMGDEVIVITDNDRFHWGKMSYGSTNCTLIRLGGKKEIIPWNTVRFISHDGFPVKKLTGADGSKLIEKIKTDDVQSIIKNALTFRLCPDCKNLTENAYLCDACRIKEEKRQEKRRMRFGDPFDIEGVSPFLVKEGSWGNLSIPWNNPNDDCLHLIAPGGAVGQLYTLETVYMFE